MADDSCLVDFEEIPDVSYDPRQSIGSLPLEVGGVASNGNPFFIEKELIPSETGKAIPELIIAVFVVQFDTRRGDVSLHS